LGWKRLASCHQSENHNSTEIVRALRFLIIVGCVPAYNEENKIAPLLVKLKPQVDKIIVCDDGSQDLTSDISTSLGALVVRHEKNMGKGMALRSLFKAALENGADIVVTIDADGQHDPSEIPALIQPILSGRADIVNGSRLSDASMPTHRRLGNAFLNRLTKQAAKTSTASTNFVDDSQSGFRAYSSTAVASLQPLVWGMGIDSQLIAEAFRMGLRVEEVPVSVKYDGDTSTHHPLRHVSDVALSILGDIAYRSPLRYLSVPGTGLTIIGFIMMLILVNYYVTSRYFSLPYAILAFLFLVSGLILFITGLILHAIGRVIDQIDRNMTKLETDPALDYSFEYRARKSITQVH
jgi:glycosyltransferase involved in cell wall biosynthesis